MTSLLPSICKINNSISLSKECYRSAWHRPGTLVSHVSRLEDSGLATISAHSAEFTESNFSVTAVTPGFQPIDWYSSPTRKAVQRVQIQVTANGQETPIRLQLPAPLTEGTVEQADSLPPY
ncbi:unnamed protein product [Protopolystoma xenopodis]|uniref:Uncharacterized protein n=1 Tax=Protopolystoma xenopodis TaxID=117903 RepID=A0A448WNA8_9PLAT|nr:unnamed protein product [Protopolystoma xenopodis]